MIKVLKYYFTNFVYINNFMVYCCYFHLFLESDDSDTEGMEIAPHSDSDHEWVEDTSSNENEASENENNDEDSDIEVL